MLTKHNLYKDSLLSNDNIGDSDRGKNTMKKIALFAFMFVLMTVTAFALPITIDEVQVNDVEIEEDDVTRLDILRDNEFEVEIRFTPTEDVDDVEFEIAIYGFEYNDINRIADFIHNADYDAGVTYVKRVDLALPDEVDEDDYKLRIIVADRNGDELIQNYRLKIDVPRHKLKIEDVILFPSNFIEAGKGLIVTVRVENKGEKTEDDVRVEISIPDLGIATADYIDEIDPDDEEETEELFLAIPVCAEEGLYNAQVKVEYDEFTEIERAVLPINILKSNRCIVEEEEEEQPVVVVVQQTPEPEEPAVTEDKPSAMKVVRRVLEVALLVLIGLLVIIGLIVGFTKMGRNSDF